MSITRRVERLEGRSPEHPMTVRVVFAGDGAATPLSPPLARNELLLKVNFVAPDAAIHAEHSRLRTS